jgi:hypothetical protein
MRASALSGTIAEAAEARLVADRAKPAGLRKVFTVQPDHGLAGHPLEHRALKDVHRM